MAAKRVLLVEDDFMLSLISKKHIELMGHQVVATAANSVDAIAAAKKHMPEVIVMDIRLNGETDGIDTAIEIGKFSSAPVIYLSGTSDDENKKRAAKTNMLAFFVKPVQLEQLQEYFSKI